MGRSYERFGPDLDRAARAIREADALLIAAGAGMGVDSGLPDFRGDAGFWRAYPLFARLGLSFIDLAQPAWFDRDPALAWGFYGHRLGLYRRAIPHAGFEILRRWAAAKPGGAFVFTSNVDGHFQRAGFRDEEIWECHGSIHHLQCARPCTDAIWSADGVEVEVDESTFRASPPLPRCPRCGGVARPNVLMFYDGAYLAGRSGQQQDRLLAWIAGGHGGSLAIVECGAGMAVPTVRSTAERLSRYASAPLIRINPREPEAPPGAISLPLGALEALQAIESLERNRDRPGQGT